MTQYSEIARALLRAILAASAMAAATGVTAVHAQTAPSTSSDQKLEEVVVTGSLIRRTDTETPAPIQTITSEDIAKQGLTSINDVLHALTANGQGNLNQGFSGAFAGGASGVALRGMTVDATLVLLDGHRMANFPVSDDGQRSFVDVANLPLGVIDHVEVLKDGASAVYGSDAIAGVVNIILKKTFVGQEFVTDYGTSYKGDASSPHFSATVGFGDLANQGHNTFFNVEYRHQSPLSLNRRSPYNNFDYYDTYGSSAPTLPGIVQPGAAYPFTNTLYGMVAQFDPANPGNPTNFQNLPGCPNPNTTTGGCPYNQAPWYQIQPETKNYNFLLRHTMNFGGDWSGSLTASMFESKAQQLNTPSNTNSFWASLTQQVNLTSPLAQPVLLPVGNVNNPFPNNPAWLFYTFGDVGPTDEKIDTRMYRLVTDFTGTIANWNVNVNLGAVRGLSNLDYYGYVTLSGLNQVIAANDYYIGANASKNSPSVYNTLAPHTSAIASSQLQYIELGAQRDLFQLPGGPFALAFGTSARHSGQDFPGQPNTLNAGTLGLGTSFIHGTETVEAVFAEAEAPLLKDVSFAKLLELDGAVRWDHYAIVGNSTTPKVGLRWKPISLLTLRGTYGQGFRAPGPGERGDAGVTFFTTAPVDPTRCPVTNLPTDCGTGTISGAIASNPLLQPEKSRSFTAGFVLQPIPAINLSVDWWEVRRVNEILGGVASPVFIRGPVQAAYPNLPGPIIQLISPYVNLGLDEPKGLDFELLSRMDAGPGHLSLVATFTHLISQTVCGFTGDPTVCFRVDGTHGPTGISGDTGTPRNRANATVSYGWGPAEGGVTYNFVSGYFNYDPSVGALGPGTPSGCLNPWYTACHIDSFSDVDVFARYDITDHVSANVHVLNVFNKEAPYDPQAAYGTRNYNNAFAQQGAIGRFIQLGVNVKF